jgi:hypothetical protein
MTQISEVLWFLRSMVSTPGLPFFCSTVNRTSPGGCFFGSAAAGWYEYPRTQERRARSAGDPFATGSMISGVENAQSRCVVRLGARRTFPDHSQTSDRLFICNMGMCNASWCPERRLPPRRTDYWWLCDRVSYFLSSLHAPCDADDDRQCSLHDRSAVQREWHKCSSGLILIGGPCNRRKLRHRKLEDSSSV